MFRKVEEYEYYFKLVVRLLIRHKAKSKEVYFLVIGYLGNGS